MNVYGCDFGCGNIVWYRTWSEAARVATEFGVVIVRGVLQSDGTVKHL